MQFRPEEENRKAVEAAFESEREAILDLLPGARVEHIGATAVPGALTKGDLDMLVSVAAGQFESAAATLRRRYAVNQPENWTAEFASFEQQPAGVLPVGVQLVAAGGRDEALFLQWRDRLRSDPQLRERFNAFKRDQTGADPEAYIEAKAAFIGTELGGEFAVAITAIDSPDVRALLNAWDEQSSREIPGFSPEDGSLVHPDDFSEQQGGRFLAGYVDGAAIACGGIRRLDAETAEVKRLYVSPAERSKGIGKRILDELEAAARERGYRRVRLDTRREGVAARSLFESRGYREIDAYNANPLAGTWFEKDL